MLWPPGVPVFMKPSSGSSSSSRTSCCDPSLWPSDYFANMLAGHMLLVTFAVLTEELVKSDTIS